MTIGPGQISWGRRRKDHVPRRRVVQVRLGPPPSPGSSRFGMAMHHDACHADPRSERAPATMESLVAATLPRNAGVARGAELLRRREMLSELPTLVTGVAHRRQHG